MRDNLFESWSEKAVSEKEENKNFLKSLPQIDKKLVHSTLVNTHNEVFAEIDCLQCANCCRTEPAILTPGDAKRIAKHLGTSPKQFIRQYAIEDINGELMLNGVPCKFLQSNNTCSIYEVRPEACRRFPHTHEAEFPSRTNLNLANTIVCPAAYHITKRLQQSLKEYDI